MSFSPCLDHPIGSLDAARTTGRSSRAPSTSTAAASISTHTEAGRASLFFSPLLGTSNRPHRPKCSTGTEYSITSDVGASTVGLLLEDAERVPAMSRRPWSPAHPGERRIPVAEGRGPKQGEPASSVIPMNVARFESYTCGPRKVERRHRRRPTLREPARLGAREDGRGDPGPESGPQAIRESYGVFCCGDPRFPTAPSHSRSFITEGLLDRICG